MATSGEASASSATTSVAVDTTHHLIITHEVTNVGTDRSQLAPVAKETKATLEVEKLDAVADRADSNSDHDGKMEVAELAAYVYAEVSTLSEQVFRARQVPQVRIAGKLSAGEPVVRTKRRRARPLDRR